MKIKEISIENELYPKDLRNIYDAPSKLYILGNIEILNKKGIAIVGSRNATQYGKQIAIKISRELSEHSINIISGLALGIDTYAHIGSILANSKGKTIAVLGSGIDVIYPKQNIELARKIIQSGGCIVSEYPIRNETRKK